MKTECPLAWPIRKESFKLLASRENALNSVDGFFFIFALRLDFEGSPHGGAEQQQADDAARIRDVAFVFDLNGRSEFAGSSHEQTRLANVKTVIPWNNKFSAFHKSAPLRRAKTVYPLLASATGNAGAG